MALIEKWSQQDGSGAWSKSAMGSKAVGQNCASHANCHTNHSKLCTRFLTRFSFFISLGTAHRHPNANTCSKKCMGILQLVILCTFFHDPPFRFPELGKERLVSFHPTHCLPADSHRINQRSSSSPSASVSQTPC